MRSLFVLALTFVVVAAQIDLECPFPGGQEDSSRSECLKYRACTWSEGICHLKVSGEIGYRLISDQIDTGHGFKVYLAAIDERKTMFGDPVEYLEVEVIYHEDYHVQVKITDLGHSRYEVPVPLRLPTSPGTNPLYEVIMPTDEMLFNLTINRLDTGTTLFQLYGALIYENQFIQITTLLASDNLYGFGENTHTSFRHKFEPRATWPIFARDQPIGEGFQNEYGHHPYYSVVEDDSGNTHTVLFFNSNAMEYSTFLLKDGTPALTLRTIGGVVDFHFFLGPEPEDANRQYVKMVGRPAFPPYWALGFHLSRFGYTSTDHIREVRARMKEAGIPQDVQTCDIDYMHKYRDFTHDPQNWGDLPALIQELHDDGLRVTLILDPALAIDWDNYPPSARGRASDVFIKWMTQDLVPEDQEEGARDYIVGYVWPDMKTVFPDFLKPRTMTWWAQELWLMHEDLAFDAIWIDMNEPANFGTDMDKPSNWPEGKEPWSLKCPDNQWDSPPYPTMMVREGNSESHRISDHSICMSSRQGGGNYSYLHYDVHSLYGWSQSLATYGAMLQLFPEKRPVVLSRSTFPGSGPYVVHWLGDNTSNWGHLKMSIIGLLEFNLFGLPMVGADICGFFNTPTTELCIRWTQLGAFYPFSRNHNFNEAPDQDPAINPELAEAARNILLVRYSYLPVLYTLFYKAHTNGDTVIRSLLNVFPSDLRARDVDDQFLWGDCIMVAPVLEEGATSRDVYFPKGRWYELAKGALASDTAGTVTVAAPLTHIPLYVRGGCILPYQTPAITTVLSRLNTMGLIIALDDHEMASGDLYWDSGDQNDMEDTFMASFTYKNGTLTKSIMRGEAVVDGLTLTDVYYNGFPHRPESVKVNGADPHRWEYLTETQILHVGFIVPLGEPMTIVIT